MASRRVVVVVATPGKGGGSPARYDHINPYGTYNFDGLETQPARTLRPR